MDADILLSTAKEPLTRDHVLVQSFALDVPIDHWQWWAWFNYDKRDLLCYKAQNLVSANPGPYPKSVRRW